MSEPPVKPGDAIKTVAEAELVQALRDAQAEQFATLEIEVHYGKPHQLNVTRKRRFGVPTREIGR